LSEFVARKPPSAERQAVGQLLWDLYMFQLHHLRQIHADPHPGNFLISTAGELIAMGFCSIEPLPADFHEPYFELIESDKIRNVALLQERLEALAMFKADDTPVERDYLTQTFQEMLLLITRPFSVPRFDFADASFFQEI